MKITITKNETELEGNLINGKVMPFGTSAHIIVSKKYLGTIVKVLIPDDTKYIWLISKVERKKLLKQAKKNILNIGGGMGGATMRHVLKEQLELLEKETFKLDYLEQVLDYVDDKKLVRKVEKLYNIP